MSDGASDLYDVEVEQVRGWERMRGLIGWFVTSLATAGSGMLPPARVAVVTDRSGDVVGRVRDRWDLVAGGWDANGGNSVDQLLEDHGELSASEFAEKWLRVD